jgi:hypothetical protein
MRPTALGSTPDRVAFCNRDGFSWDLPNESPEIVNVEAPGDG